MFNKYKMRPGNLEGPGWDPYAGKGKDSKKTEEQPKQGCNASTNTVCG